MKSFKLNDLTGGVVADFSKRGAYIGGEHGPDVAELLVLVERMTNGRECRKDFFGDELLGDPAWDMLIHLFHADLSDYRVTITNLASASGVPYTTAMRWMNTLIEKGLASRTNNPLDRRIVFMAISEPARASMYNYICKIWLNYPA